MSVKPGASGRGAPRRGDRGAKRLADGDGAAIAILLLDRFDGPELEAGGAQRLVAAHAGAEVVVDVKLEVALELGRELALAARPLEQPA